MTERLEDTWRGWLVYDGTRTPLKTALFLLLVLTWLLPGLVGHDPWKVDEATVFGAVTGMLSSGDWLLFRIAGEPYLERAPLFLWVAAGFARLLGGILPLHDAARLASGFFLAATLAFLSLTAMRLMGERAIRVGVLLFIGCLGLLIRAHEMTTHLAGLAGIAMALYGLALASTRPYLGGAVTGAGIGLAFLGDGFLPVAMVVMLLALLPAVSSFWRTRRYGATAATAVVTALPLIALWPAALWSAAPHWLQLWLDAALAWNPPFADEGGLGFFYFTSILPWYAWPAWPLAAWALWRSRRTLTGRPELLLPLTAFGAFLIVASVFGNAREVNAMPLLLPLAILGVAELDTLPRGAASALDWFGVTTFFLFAALLWLGWTAAVTGKPDFALAWLTKEVPGFTYRFRFLAFALAALLTLVWLVVVARSLRSTRRAVVNWTAGIAMIWMLMMTLGLPLVDQARSYRALASRVVENLPPGFECVARRNVGDAQRALLDYFVNLRTISAELPAAARCQALLVQASPTRVPPVPAQWTESWRGARPGDRNELFIVYRRIDPPLPPRDPA
jgi:4-amino-4-deoxy-L-arabinose transferase-like glycosyltransferase